MDLATGMEIIAKRGSFFSYGDLRLGQGRENAKEFLKQNPELIDEIEQAVRRNAASSETIMPFGSIEEDAGVEDEEI